MISFYTIKYFLNIECEALINIQYLIRQGRVLFYVNYQKKVQSMKSIEDRQAGFMQVMKEWKIQKKSCYRYFISINQSSKNHLDNS